MRGTEKRRGRMENKRRRKRGVEKWKRKSGVMINRLPERRACRSGCSGTVKE